MLEVKTWLETTGMKVAENCFLKPPSLPYIVFLENLDSRGADDRNCIANRAIRIELYAGRIDKLAEEKIENLLSEKAIPYKKDRAWIDEEKFFETMYDFELVEKI